MQKDIMNKTKTQILKKKINTKLNSLDIAWYLIEDIRGSLKFLHYYKLKNLLKNIEDLAEYLYILDIQNTKQVKVLCEQNVSLLDVVQKNNYYISISWWEAIETKKSKVISTKTSIDHQLQSVVLSTKWILLLTLNEFCNATNTRIYLNKVMRQRQLERSKA